MVHYLGFDRFFNIRRILSLDMNTKSSHNPFSLIADFEGEIGAIFNQCKDETLPILPVRNMVLFPGVVAPVSVSRRSTHKLVREAAERDCFIGVVCQRDADKNTPPIRANRGCILCCDTRLGERESHLLDSGLGGCGYCEEIYNPLITDA